MTPVVILVAPQLGENIGMAARAMYNCGIESLRLVRPRAGWCDDADAVVHNSDLYAAYQNYVSALMASAEVLRKMPKVQVFDTLLDASCDVQFLYASTARPRSLHMHIYSPSEAGTKMHQQAQHNIRTGLVFGCEASGLSNDDVAACHGVVTIPLNPHFTSLNLSQAVLLLCWEWWRQSPQAVPAPVKRTPPIAAIPHANRAVDSLENALQQRGFFKSETSGPVVRRQLRAMCNRLHMNTQEVQMLHGIVRCLTEYPKK